jgi:hypothetical protein
VMLVDDAFDQFVALCFPLGNHFHTSLDEGF